MKKVCVLIGHRDTPAEVRKPLLKIVKELAEAEPEIHFMVGHQGKFDAMALSVLHELKKEFPALSFEVVLAYMPTKKIMESILPDTETVYPPMMETVPPRYAISRRNQWMLKQADIVVAYAHFHGGAYQFREKALKQNKRVIDIIL